MNIYGKADIRQTRFKDLCYGDVFCFVKDIKDISSVKIYMRGGENSARKTAMNLETGIVYSFDDNEPVTILNAQLTIKEPQK